jgi:plastocyanin
MRGSRSLLLALAGVALVAAPVTAGAAKSKSKSKSKTKQVKVLDNFYSPKKVTVRAGTTVRWVWPEDGGDVHDVKLTKGPKGVKKFQSEVAAAEYTYKRKLTKKGKYFIICTLHEEMTMNITVR